MRESSMYMCISETAAEGRLLIMLKGAMIVPHVAYAQINVYIYNLYSSDWPNTNCSRCSAIIVQHYTDDCYMMVIVNW